MRLRTAVRLALFIAILALPADALGAQTVRPSSVAGSLVVQRGAPSNIRLHCGPREVALNAAVYRQGPGVTVLRSVPGEDAGGWAFRVKAEGRGSRAVTTVLRCLHLRLPAGLTGAQLTVRTKNQPGIAIAPGATASPRIGCARGFTATGYALSGGNGRVRFARAVPLARTWRFTLENTGSRTAHVRVSIRCLRSEVTARRSEGGTAKLRFGFARPSFERTFAAGSSRRESTAGCGGRRFSVAAGIALDPADPLQLLTAGTSALGASRWTFGDVSTGDSFRAYMVCLRLGSRFR
jgi:hypothetical protein